MDEVTQQNSALVEENAATAKTLEQQSTAMNERVDAFNIGDDRGAGAVSRPAAAPKRPVAAVQPKASAKRPVAAARKIGNGTAHSMQTALATAVNGDASWQEF